MATGGMDEYIEECGSDIDGGRIGSKCEPCRRRDRSEVASLFCNTCKEYLCDDCCDGHKLYMKNVDGHHIIAAHEACVKPDVDMNGLDQCIEHKRVFMFHCADHEDLCCEICAFSRHRRCDNIHEIAKVAKNVKDDEREKIRASIITASEVIMKCEENQLNNVSRVEEIIQEIDIYNEGILTKIEEAKARIVSEMTNHNTQESERLNTRRNAAEKLKKELGTHLAMSDSVRDNGMETEIFILNHILKRAQDKAAQSLNTLLKNDYTVKMGLTINEIILKIKSTDFALFSLSKTQEPNKHSLNGHGVTNAVKSSTDEQQTNQQRPVSLELLKTMEVVKTGDDNTAPFVTGLDFLPDGRVVAVDHYNCKCFILSDTLKRLVTFDKFKTYPKDVISYSDDNIAVTFNDQTICLLTVDRHNTITLMNTLTTSAYCDSICPLNDRAFVVSTWDDPRPARMIDVDGKESDFDNVKFPGKTYKLGESKCTYIPSRDTLVLIDRFAHTVYMYNTVSGKGEEVKDDRIREPAGACAGPDASVFVCSMNTNSVIQIPPDADILASCDVDMKYPYAVAVSRDGSRMAVSNSVNGVSPMTRVDKADNMELTVFHMKRLQHQQRAVHVANEATEAASSATSYQTGFLDCLREAVAYRVSDDACDPVVATIVSGHLRSVYAQKQNSSQAA
ncbi:uncharacterized protein LOC128219313 [Mya arenaria]|uniref:uncharacterized protein LOC128219313 n=1 Tax=Mya arenaria TaxID=6604 RepID=UPI0022E4FED2|nr:uncharacterized protein LOC128219313 [Mya arenaria]